MIAILAFCSLLAVMVIFLGILVLLTLPAERSSWTWIDTKPQQARRTLAIMELLLLIPIGFTIAVIVLYR